MRIKTVSIPMTETDNETIRRGADYNEREQIRPQPRPAIKDFMLQVALERANQLIEKHEKARGERK